MKNKQKKTDCCRSSLPHIREREELERELLKTYFKFLTLYKRYIFFIYFKFLKNRYKS